MLAPRGSGRDVQKMMKLPDCAKAQMRKIE